MTIQSVGNTLTPQQILQMALQGQLTNADPNGTAVVKPETDPNAGQNLPTGTDGQAAADTTAAAPVTSNPATLDPKTVMALLQIQESRSMQTADTLIYGSNSSGAASTGDPLLDALNVNGPDMNAIDPMQSLLSSLSTNSSANDVMSSANQTLLDFLKSNGATIDGQAPTDTPQDPTITPTDA